MGAEKIIVTPKVDQDILDMDFSHLLGPVFAFFEFR